MNAPESLAEVITRLWRGPTNFHQCDLCESEAVVERCPRYENSDFVPIHCCDACREEAVAERCPHYYGRPLYATPHTPSPTIPNRPLGE